MMENNILINGLFLISKGGIERFSYELVKRLPSENKFRFVILVPDRKLNQDQVNAFPEHIEIEIVPGKGGVLCLKSSFHSTFIKSTMGHY